MTVVEACAVLRFLSLWMILHWHSSHLLLLVRLLLLVQETSAALILLTRRPKMQVFLRR